MFADKSELKDALIAYKQKLDFNKKMFLRIIIMCGCHVESSDPPVKDYGIVAFSKADLRGHILLSRRQLDPYQKRPTGSYYLIHAKQGWLQNQYIHLAHCISGHKEGVARQERDLLALGVHANNCKRLQTT